MKNSNQKDFKITCLEIINHILTSHPTLHENISELCSQISGKKSEFKII